MTLNREATHIPEPHELPPDQYAWLRQARTEYAAAALTAEMLHWIIMIGLSPETLERGARVVADEVGHAHLCHELYLLCGGTLAVAVEPAALRHAADPGAPLLMRALTAAGQLAIEESIALPVFSLRVRNAVQPRVREVVERILRDEAFHRAYAWDVLDELIERMGLDVARGWVRPRLASWTRPYLSARLRDDEPVWSDAQLGMGLIDRREHWQAMRACLSDVVLPRFAKRGLVNEQLTAAELAAELANHTPPTTPGRPT